RRGDRAAADRFRGERAVCPQATPPGPVRGRVAPQRDGQGAEEAAQLTGRTLTAVTAHQAFCTAQAKVLEPPLAGWGAAARLPAPVAWFPFWLYRVAPGALAESMALPLETNPTTTLFDRVPATVTTARVPSPNAVTARPSGALWLTPAKPTDPPVNSLT